MNRFGNYLFVLTFLLFISILGTTVLLKEDLTESYWENRTLATRPELDKESILDGSFTKKYEEFFTDQFFNRDFWVKSYMDIQILTNQTFINDYYIDKNFIFPKPLNSFPKEHLERSANEVNKLGKLLNEKEIEFFFFYLPSRNLVLSANYPSYIDEGYGVKSKDYLYELVTNPTIKKVDMDQLFKQKFSINELKEFYYLSDHHWNSLGALKGYEMILSFIKDNSSLEVVDFHQENYEEVFPIADLNYLGSYNRQLYNLVKSGEERTSHFIPKSYNTDELEVYVGSKDWAAKNQLSSVFGTEMNGTETNDLTYGGIFTGDYRELTIINPSLIDAGKKVLVVKDSYANPFVSLLPENFYQTTFFDLRYNTDRSLTDFIEANEFDAVFLMYNGTTIYDVMYDFELSLY